MMSSLPCLLLSHNHHNPILLWQFEFFTEWNSSTIRHCLMGNDPLRAGTTFETVVIMQGAPAHPVLKRQNRLGKDPFAGFGTVVEDIKRSGYTKNQPILLGAF